MIHKIIFFIFFIIIFLQCQTEKELDQELNQIFLEVLKDGFYVKEDYRVDSILKTEFHKKRHSNGEDSIILFNISNMQGFESFENLNFINSKNPERHADNIFYRFYLHVDSKDSIHLNRYRFDYLDYLPHFDWDVTRETFYLEKKRGKWKVYNHEFHLNI